MEAGDSQVTSAPHLSASDSLEKDGKIKAFEIGSEAEPVLVARRLITDHLQITMVIEQRVAIVQLPVSVEVDKLNISRAEEEIGAVLQERLVNRLFPVRTGLQFISLTASILYTLGLRKGYLYGVAIGVQLEIVLLVEPVGTVPPNFAKRLADVVAVHPLGRPVSGNC